MKTFLTPSLWIILFVFLFFNLNAQNIRINEGSTTPDSSVIFEISSTQKVTRNVGINNKYPNHSLDVEGNARTCKLFIGPSFVSNAFDSYHNLIDVEAGNMEHAAIELSNAMVTGGIELEHKSACWFGEGIMNVGLQTNRGLIEKHPLVSPMGVWMQLDSRASEKSIKWIFEDNWQDDEAIRMRLSFDGRLYLNEAYYLPNSDGVPGSVLTTDGEGKVSWTAPEPYPTDRTWITKGVDYTEWLEKEDTLAQFALGEIVGIRNGKITKKTQKVDQIMVVSSRPVVLRNTPEEGKKNNYEKVCFMGQVLTLIQGEAKTGDYIVPCGNNNGYGKAIAPENITIADIPNIIGKAWSDSGDGILDYVNVSVGLSNSEMAKLMQEKILLISELEQKISKLEVQISEETVSMEVYNQLVNRIEKLELNFTTSARK